MGNHTATDRAGAYRPVWAQGMALALVLGLAAVAGLGLPGCAADAGGDGELGGVISHQFDTIHIDAFEETQDYCQSWTLHNEEPLYVNAVVMKNNKGFHHANWYWVPEGNYPGPDGTWLCDDRNFDQLSAAVSGGVVFAMSTQATQETQAFPAGAGYIIPPHAMIVGNLHLLNASDQALDTWLSMELHTIPADQLEVKLDAMALDYNDLQIPPMAHSRFQSTCDFATAYGAPIDFRFYYVLPHFHALGVRGTFKAEGMPGGEKVILDREATIGDVLSQTLDPPFDATGATALTFSCDYVNTTDQVVHEGIGTNEMCIMVAWQDSGYFWGGTVSGGTQQIGTDADGTMVYSGPCRLAYLQDRN